MQADLRSHTGNLPNILLGIFIPLSCFQSYIQNLLMHFLLKNKMLTFWYAWKWWSKRNSTSNTLEIWFWWINTWSQHDLLSAQLLSAWCLPLRISIKNVSMLLCEFRENLFNNILPNKYFNHTIVNIVIYHKNVRTWVISLLLMYGSWAGKETCQMGVKPISSLSEGFPLVYSLLKCFI